jgi:AcrR family transcriptional regulator
MQAIADRSKSSIGALYNYFPDKESVAATLLSGYAEELQWRLKSLMEHSEKLSTAQFAGAFIDCIIEFTQGRPAYINLHTAPIRFRRDPSARKALRAIIADALNRNSWLRAIRMSDDANTWEQPELFTQEIGAGVQFAAFR